MLEYKNKNKNKGRHLLRRNKPRHALSLQTGSVEARKGRFCLFSLCSERGDEKNR